MAILLHQKTLRKYGRTKKKRLSSSSLNNRKITNSFDAVNIGFARFTTHFEDKTVKTLSTVKPKTNKQTKKENKVLSNVPRSLQLVKNQKGKISYKMSYH